MLPRVIPHTEVAGAYRGIPLYGDIGDHQASVYGLGEDTTNSIILTLGTAGILCMPSNRPGQSEMEERPYFHGQSLLTKTRQPGGRTLDLLVRFVGDCAALVTGGPVEAGKRCRRGRLWMRRDCTSRRNTFPAAARE